MAAAAEALPGVLGGLVALGSLPLPVLPGPPGIAVPISAPGQFPAIAPTGLLPAQALAGTLATPWPVPLGSGVGGSLSGEFEAGLPSPWALAWTPARGVVLRGPSIASGARVARYDAAPASVPAGSGSGEVSGGSSSSAAGGTGFSLATLLVPAALLLLAVPRLMRRLSLSCEQSLATAFALIPERPG